MMSCSTWVHSIYILFFLGMPNSSQSCVKDTVTVEGYGRHETHEKVLYNGSDSFRYKSRPPLLQWFEALFLGGVFQVRSCV